MNDLVPVSSITRPVERSAPTQFDLVSIGLHWATALMILALFASAWSLVLVNNGAEAADLLTLHRSLGVTAWILSVCRLSWRLSFARRPPLPASLPRLQHRAAAISEFGLYALLLAQPLTGLAQSLARGRPFHIFVFEVPKVMAKNKPLTAAFHETHEVAAWILLGLIGLHVAAALLHRFVLKDRVLQSMSPWGRE